jgi:GntR family transcriptional repressor for pyruvate dehydrogenase complex
VSDPGTDSALRSQTDVVIRRITGLVASGELAPGTRLPIERDLAAQLGVSRGSLREGVRALVTMGVLETRQGDGSYVTSLDPSLLLGPLAFLAELQSVSGGEELLEVRRVLEAEAASRAAATLTEEELERLAAILDRSDAALAAGAVDVDTFLEADVEFHRGIAGAHPNAVFRALVDVLGGRTMRARAWRAIEQRGALAETQAEHLAILGALRGRDPERARAAMSAHLLAVVQFLRDHDPGAAATS